MLERHRGVEIGTIGDGFLATFGSAFHAVRAADDESIGSRTLKGIDEPDELYRVVPRGA